MSDLFNVVCFFQDGSYEYMDRNVSPEVAVMNAKGYTESVGARLGLTTKVMITDSDDCCNFEWRYGEGVVYPKPEDLTNAIQN